jgi:hypothetical protein
MDPVGTLHADPSPAADRDTGSLSLACILLSIPPPQDPCKDEGNADTLQPEALHNSCLGNSVCDGSICIPCNDPDRMDDGDQHVGTSEECEAESDTPGTPASSHGTGTGIGKTVECENHAGAVDDEFLDFEKEVLDIERSFSSATIGVLPKSPTTENMPTTDGCLIPAPSGENAAPDTFMGRMYSRLHTAAPPRLLQEMHMALQEVP